MNECKRCKHKYEPRSSTSSLRLQYCSSLCEIFDLGFFLPDIEEWKWVKVPEDEIAPRSLEGTIDPTGTLQVNKVNDHDAGGTSRDEDDLVPV